MTPMWVQTQNLWACEASNLRSWQASCWIHLLWCVCKIKVIRFYWIYSLQFLPPLWLMCCISSTITLKQWWCVIALYKLDAFSLSLSLQCTPGRFIFPMLNNAVSCDEARAVQTGRQYSEWDDWREAITDTETKPVEPPRERGGSFIGHFPLLTSTQAVYKIWEEIYYQAKSKRLQPH